MTPHRPPAALGPHIPLRPLWLCKADALPWPCGEARLALVDKYRADRVSLAIYLATNFAEAAHDIYTLHPDTGPDPLALSTRFLGWLPPRHTQRGKPDGWPAGPQPAVDSGLPFP